MTAAIIHGIIWKRGCWSLLGGRAAEEVAIGEITTGAANDLRV